jgi:hypothetical protein
VTVMAVIFWGAVDVLVIVGLLASVNRVQRR